MERLEAPQCAAGLSGICTERLAKPMDSEEPALDASPGPGLKRRGCEKSTAIIALRIGKHFPVRGAILFCCLLKKRHMSDRQCHINKKFLCQVFVKKAHASLTQMGKPW